MYVTVGIHHPRPGKEKAILETMPRFGKAQRRKKGLITVFGWKDDETGALIGTALWDAKADYEAARPDMSKALEGVDFKPLEYSAEVYRGSPVLWEYQSSGDQGRSGTARAKVPFGREHYTQALDTPSLLRLCLDQSSPSGLHVPHRLA
jgi:hypothetical protein